MVQTTFFWHHPKESYLFISQEDTIKDCIMTTKRSFNAVVTSTQSIKVNNKKQGTNSSSWLQKLDILYAQMIFLPEPGLKPIKQVHLYTKWRTVVPHPHKDEICPLPSNEIIRMVIKTKKLLKKEKQLIMLATTMLMATTIMLVLVMIQPRQKQTRKDLNSRNTKHILSLKMGHKDMWIQMK